jgi:hypothetical protein
VTAGRKERQGTPKQNHRPDTSKGAGVKPLRPTSLSLREHDAAQHRAFIQIEEDACRRHPDPTRDDIAAAEAAELPSRPGRGRGLNCVAASCP